MTAGPATPRPRDPGTLGLTVVYCAGDACSAAGLPVGERLGEVIRDSRHGVLISTPCLLAALGAPAGWGAAARGHGLVFVQSCDVRERRAVGPGVLVGPIRSEVDLQVLCAWLRDGVPDVARLPARLRYRLRRPQPALN